MRVNLTVFRGQTARVQRRAECDAVYPPKVGRRFKVTLDDGRTMSTGAVTRVAGRGVFYTEARRYRVELLEWPLEVARERGQG